MILSPTNVPISVSLVFDNTTMCKIQKAVYFITSPYIFLESILVTRNLHQHYRVVFTVPEESHEPELLGHGIVNLVLWIPVINLFPLGQGRLLEQLDHLHRFRVCRTNNFSKDVGTQSGHP